MRTVTLGATGLAVTPLAYGTWQFGGDWGPVDEQAAIAAIQHARSLGINFFDTAQAYGFGRSERLLDARTPAHLAESLGAPDLTLSQADLADIDEIMAAAVPADGPTPEGMS